MSRRKRVNVIKESAAERNLRAFVTHICEGDLAQANRSLDNAVREKIKTRIKQNLKEN